MKYLPILFLLGAATALGGCASPDARIKDNPSVYSQLTPEQQALVKQGHIGLGMPQAGVQLALGKPDRISEHTDAGGVQQIWHYTQVNTSYINATAYPYGYGLGWSPRYYDPFFSASFYGNVPVQTESDKMRVVLKDGRVAAIEREM